jgi:methionine synthase II (cobalamin-independent)
MFATLGGSLPSLLPPADSGAASDAAVAAAVRAAVRAQEAAGLEPITDGGARHRDPVGVLAAGLDGIEIHDQGTGPVEPGTAERGPGGRPDRHRSARPPVARSLPMWRGPILLDGWRATAALTDRAVKQSIVGPYTLGRRVAPGTLGRAAVTLALAEALASELAALAEAGCPLIEVIEDGAVAIGDDPAERRLFVDAQRRLLGRAGRVHCTLSIRGGNADPSGAATILEAPYASHLFDLCAGPDNWRLVVAVPADRGVIVGAADARTSDAETIEILAFAIGYAASTGERGHARVGLATSGDMTGLPPGAALAKMDRIGTVARLYAAGPGALARAIDPRSVDIRGAATGRYASPRAPGVPKDDR